MDGFEIVTHVPVCLTSDRAAALEVFRQTVERYSNLPFYRKVLDAGAFKDQLADGVISDELMDGLAGIGDEHQVQAPIPPFNQPPITLPPPPPFSAHQRT